MSGHSAIMLATQAGQPPCGQLELKLRTHSPDLVPHPRRQRLQQQLAANLLQRLQAVLEQLELAVHQREAHRHCGLARVRWRTALNRTPGGGERRLAERRRSSWRRALIGQKPLLRSLRLPVATTAVHTGGAESAVRAGAHWGVVQERKILLEHCRSDRWLAGRSKSAQHLPPPAAAAAAAAGGGPCMACLHELTARGSTARDTHL